MCSNGRPSIKFKLNYKTIKSKILKLYRGLFKKVKITSTVSNDDVTHNEVIKGALPLQNQLMSRPHLLGELINEIQPVNQTDLI